VRFLLLAVLLTGCAPPVLKGTGDLKLRAILTAPEPRATAIVPLLAPDVVALVAREPLQGADSAAMALAELRVEGDPAVFRHHDVTLVLLGSGRALLLERSADDRIVKAVELPAPAAAGELPQRLYWYGAAWNTDDRAARRDLILASYAQGARYVDPGHDVTGPEEVAQMIGNLRMVAPGSVIQYVSAVTEAGGGWATEDWVMLSRPGGRVLFRGMDIFHLGEDGKIDYLAGFIGTRTPL
jgi:SnoaL-like domain